MKTEKLLISVAYRDSNAVFFVASDKSTYLNKKTKTYPRFINNKDCRYEDSTVYFGEADHKEIVIDMQAKKGKKLHSNFGKGWIVSDKGVYADSLLYFTSIYKTNKHYCSITYVHNLGFVSEEQKYKDSLIQWRLESISGIPLDLIIKEYPNYEFFKEINTRFFTIPKDD